MRTGQRVAADEAFRTERAGSAGRRRRAGRRRPSGPHRRPGPRRGGRASPAIRPSVAGSITASATSPGSGMPATRQDAPSAPDPGARLKRLGDTQRHGQLADRPVRARPSPSRPRPAAPATGRQPGARRRPRRERADPLRALDHQTSSRSGTAWPIRLEAGALVHADRGWVVREDTEVGPSAAAATASATAAARHEHCRGPRPRAQPPSRSTRGSSPHRMWRGGRRWPARRRRGRGSG